MLGGVYDNAADWSDKWVNIGYAHLPIKNPHQARDANAPTNMVQV